MTALLPLTILLALLRVSGAIEIPWWLVLAPVYVPAFLNLERVATALSITARHLEDA